MKKDLIGISEAAAIHNMVPSHLQYYIKKDRFVQGYEVAGRTLFSKADVIKWKPELKKQGRPKL